MVILAHVELVGSRGCHERARRWPLAPVFSIHG